MATAQNNGLSVLTFDGVHLAFPLNEVAGVQQVSLLDKNSELPLALGSVVHGGRSWPVFGLSGNLELLTTLPAQRTYCICLSADDSETGLALACDTVNAIALAPGLSPPSIPTCMQRADSPLRQWYRHGEQILPISSTPALARYIKNLMEQDDG